jgi:hypothetical protein
LIAPAPELSASDQSVIAPAFVCNTRATDEVPPLEVMSPVALIKILEPEPEVVMFAFIETASP